MTPPIAPPTLALCWFELPVLPLSPVLGGGPKVDDDVSSEVVNTVGISEDRVSGRAVGNEVCGGSGTAVDGEMVGSGAENILGGQSIYNYVLSIHICTCIRLASGTGF